MRSSARLQPCVWSIHGNIKINLISECSRLLRITARAAKLSNPSAPPQRVFIPCIKCNNRTKTFVKLLYLRRLHPMPGKTTCLLSGGNACISSCQITSVDIAMKYKASFYKVRKRAIQRHIQRDRFQGKTAAKRDVVVYYAFNQANNFATR